MRNLRCPKYEKNIMLLILQWRNEWVSAAVSAATTAKSAAESTAAAARPSKVVT